MPYLGSFKLNYNFISAFIFMQMISGRIFFFSMQIRVASMEILLALFFIICSFYYWHFEQKGRTLNYVDFSSQVFLFSISGLSINFKKMPNVSPIQIVKLLCIFLKVTSHCKYIHIKIYIFYMNMIIIINIVECIYI